jgi:hypothetical protein
MTQRQTVLSMLKRAHKDGVTNGAFAEAGILRYSARIEELRKAGHFIVKQRVSGRCWKYTLLERSVPRPEYQAGAGAAVDAEQASLFELPPASHYRDAA